MSTFSGRYSGRPLVPLLECYVLWAIGELGEEQSAILAEMTPALRSIYHADGDWPDVIAAAMAWRPDMPRRIRAPGRDKCCSARADRRQPPRCSRRPMWTTTSCL